MAHSTNRSIDFAPAWLKLPEHNQEQRRQDASYNSSSTNFEHNSYIPQLRSNSSLAVSTNSINNSSSPVIVPHHQHSIHNSHQQQPFSSSSYHSNNHQQPQIAASQQQQHSPSGAGGHQQQHFRSGRHQLTSYNGRLSLSGPASSQSHTAAHLQRSQSTGSYSEGTVRAAAVVSSTGANVTTSIGNPPLEEDFPVLRSGPSSGSASQAPVSNQVNKTAQWRVKERARDDSNNKGGSANPLNDNLLTGNMSGKKVYRAQVKPVKRSNMIPISNGGVTSASSNISSKVLTSRENGDHTTHNVHSSLSNLSSSLDKEKKFLQELGWNEDEGSDEDCGIPEQDPAQLQQIMQQAKAARQRLLMNCKQTMKTVPTAVLPNEDDIPSSSSDNSDVE